MLTRNKSKFIISTVISMILTASLFTGCGCEAKKDTTASTVQTSTAGTSTTESQTIEETSSEDITTVEPETEEATEATTVQEIVVPTVEGDEPVQYFSAVFSPYMAIDTYTDKQCSLKEVFGSSYNGGTITFNDDGTFVDGIKASSANTGAYVYKDNNLSATYSDDKNMIVSVLRLNDDGPVEIIVNYGGYDVYFQ